MNGDLHYFSDSDTYPAICAPFYAGDAGFDLVVNREVCISPRGFSRIQLDLFIAIPEGHVGMIKDRSGHAAGGLHVIGGVIDAGYRGRISIVFVNFSDHAKRFTDGDRIAQLLILPVATPALTRVDDLADLGSSERAARGFGSTDGNQR